MVPVVRGQPQGEARYQVALEGLAGQTYEFTIGAPDAAAAEHLSATTTGGTVEPAAWKGGATRAVRVTFPTTGANDDGYTAATVTFSAQGRM